MGTCMFLCLQVKNLHESTNCFHVFSPFSVHVVSPARSPIILGLSLSIPPFSTFVTKTSLAELSHGEGLASLTSGVVLTPRLVLQNEAMERVWPLLPLGLYSHPD